MEVKDNHREDLQLNLKPTFKQMMLQLPKDLIRGKIILRARHLNSLIDELNIFTNPQLKIFKQYVNVKGSYIFKYGKIEFFQKAFLDGIIGRSSYNIYLTDDTDKKSTITINLEDISLFKQYLSVCQNNEIINNLSLDTIKVSTGKLVLISTDKIEISINEKVINNLLNYIPFKEYGIYNLSLILNEDFITIHCNYSIKGVDFEIKKNIKIAQIDIYERKQIVLEFDNLDMHNSKINVRVNYLNFISNKFVKLLVSKLANKHVELDEENERIVIS